LLKFITICSGVVLTCSQACPGLLPDLSRFSLEKAGKTGRSVGEILDQSARRSGGRWENKGSENYRREGMATWYTLLIFIE